MSNNVAFSTGVPATPPGGTVVETEDRGSGVHRQIVGGVVAAVDSGGGMCYPDSYPQTLTYNADGTVNTIAFTNGTNTWTQTLGYTTGKVTSISAWVKS